MTHLEFRKIWQTHMEKSGHKLIPDMPLPSYSDPTLLFVNSGMFPLVPYLEGQAHPLGKRIYNNQRCLRPMEFDGIGDNRHTSVFEMLGNWSLGDYFKKEQLENLYSFFIDDLGLDPNRIYASVFVGDEDAPRDNESIEILKSIFDKYGIVAEVAPDNYNLICKETEVDLSKYRIFPYAKSENWWQRGDSIGELGGPDSETFYDLRIEHDSNKWGFPHPATDSGRFIEFGNSVFMQYKKTESGWEELPQKNVDFGGGVERTLMIVNNKTDIFSTDLYEGAIKILEEKSKVKYAPNEANLSKEIIAFRVIADHIKAAVFMLQDGVVPSNKEQGYILRRALRRAMRFARVLNINEPILPLVAVEFINTYKSVYPALEEKQKFIIDEIQKEEEKFTKTLERGRKELTKKITKITTDYKSGDLESVVSIISNIEQTNGYPADFIIEDLMQSNSLEINDTIVEELKELLEKETEKHKALSRSGAEKRFKGGLADTKETTVRYHTCAHLLLKALQLIVSKNIHQKGQNITDERLRYDFNFDRPLTIDELENVEKHVNDWINEGLVVSIDTMEKSKLSEVKAEASFLDRYPDIVTVYKFMNPTNNEIVSYEVCGGPHVENTKDILKSGKFKITKEQSSSSGVRRIRAELV